jgi:hypothetical protein
MHRVRQTLPYLKKMGWEPVVCTVQMDKVEAVPDHLLLHTVPEGLRIEYVDAFSTRWTRKVGLGSLALRSLWFYFKKVNHLLKNETFDLIYFSTTQFPVMVLGAYWKKYFGIPYVIDMQDPWHSDYYQNKPPSERPPKYWFSYRLNKYLEPIAFSKVDGVLSVSAAYLEVLQQRYPRLSGLPLKTLTFGAFERDFDVLQEQKVVQNLLPARQDNTCRLVYVGRAGHDMRTALSILFQAIQLLPAQLGTTIRMYFIGTSYAPGNTGKGTVAPVAAEFDMQDQVIELPRRVPYFEALAILKEADILVVPGSDDAQYTASKIFPYILAKKPLLAIFHQASSIVSIVNTTQSGEVITFHPDMTIQPAIHRCCQVLENLLLKVPFQPNTDWGAFAEHTAEAKAREQVQLFDSVIKVV